MLCDEQQGEPFISRIRFRADCGYQCYFIEACCEMHMPISECFTVYPFRCSTLRLWHHQAFCMYLSQSIECISKHWDTPWNEMISGWVMVCRYQSITLLMNRLQFDSEVVWNSPKPKAELIHSFSRNLRSLSSAWRLSSQLSPAKSCNLTL